VSAADDVVRVLVVGDTHLRDGSRIPDAVFRLAERADAILHTGDVMTQDVLAVLGSFAPVTVVLGNNDGELVGRVPERTEVELGGVRFGMVHDGGTASGRHERLRGWFPDCGAVLYGHSHAPELAWSEGVLVLNPGSPTQRRRAPTHTVAWLELARGAVVEANLVEVGR
jgi:putative phosphoesterase